MDNLNIKSKNNRITNTKVYKILFLLLLLGSSPGLALGQDVHARPRGSEPQSVHPENGKMEPLPAHLWKAWDHQLSPRGLAKEAKSVEFSLQLRRSPTLPPMGVPLKGPVV